MQDFIKLSASVHELSCSQCFDDAENNTAVASAGNKTTNAKNCTLGSDCQTQKQVDRIVHGLQWRGAAT